MFEMIEEVGMTNDMSQIHVCLVALLDHLDTG